MYDFTVIGAGIAGIAIAEILQRAGKRVLLLEAGKYACAEASSQQAGWFHTGALYAALPNPSFSTALVNNLNIIDTYYKDFENMNFSINGGVHLTKNGGWFSDNLIYYYYVSSRAREVEFWKKLPWWLVTQTIKGNGNRHRHYVEHVYYDSLPDLVLPTIDHSQIALILSSYDRTMDSRLMAIDLLRSFFGNGGEMRRNTNIVGIGKNHVNTASETIQCHHVIVTAGEKIRDLTNLNMRVVISPIAVAYPALTTHNFVKITPSRSKIFNHLYHPCKGQGYSVIGNSNYFLETNAEVYSRVRSSFSEMIKSFFPNSNSNLGFYYGHKTEIVGTGQLRNYQSHIIDSGIYLAAIPGKFSLSFSLAVNVCRHYGIKPVSSLNNLMEHEKIENLVSFPEHYNKALELAGM
jgi:hypothetical protein